MWPRAAAPLRRPAAGGASRRSFDAKISADGRWLAVAWNRVVDVWDLEGAAASETLTLRSGAGRLASPSIPAGRGWPSKTVGGVALAVDDAPFPQSCGLRAKVNALPDGRSARPMDCRGTRQRASVQVWPLKGEPGDQGRTLDAGAPISLPDTSLAAGDFLIAGTMAGVRLSTSMAARPSVSPVSTAWSRDWPWTRPAPARRRRRSPGRAGSPRARPWSGSGISTPVQSTCSTRAMDSRVLDVEFMPDGRLLAAGPAGVRLWDLRTRDLDAIDGRPRRAGAAERRRPLRPGLPCRAASGGAVGSASYTT